MSVLIESSHLKIRLLKSKPSHTICSDSKVILNLNLLKIGLKSILYVYIVKFSFQRLDSN